MGSMIAETFQYGDQFGCPYEPGFLSFIGCLCFLFVDSVEIIRHYASGDSSLVHHLSHGLIQDINIAEDWNMKATAAHGTDELVEFTGVIAQLGDDEIRAGLQLVVELVVLGHHLGLEFLERGDVASLEEMRENQDIVARHLAVDIHALIHEIDEADQLDRIEIKNRLGFAFNP